MQFLIKCFLKRPQGMLHSCAFFLDARLNLLHASLCLGHLDSSPEATLLSSCSPLPMLPCRSVEKGEEAVSAGGLSESFRKRGPDAHHAGMHSPAPQGRGLRSCLLHLLLQVPFSHKPPEYRATGAFHSIPQNILEQGWHN